MAIPESQKRAVAKYKAQNYEQIKIDVRKGYREVWKSAADKSGKSLTQFIVDAVEKEIDNECLR